MIKNLNQLKRRLRPGTRLEVTGHCRPGCIGQLWAGLHNVVGCSQHLVI